MYHAILTVSALLRITIIIYCGCGLRNVIVNKYLVQFNGSILGQTVRLITVLTVESLGTNGDEPHVPITLATPTNNEHHHNDYHNNHDLLIVLYWLMVVTLTTAWLRQSRWKMLLRRVRS